MTALKVADMVCLQTDKAALSRATDDRRDASTRSWLQRLLLGSYGLLSRSRLLSTGMGRALFETAYDFYKARWEAPGISALKAFARPGTIAIDVGANIGFFTRRFAEWVRPGGMVIAIEPEAHNFRSLTAMLSRRGLLNVEPIQAVAAESNGTLKLQINSLHPADHRISEIGTEVRATTLDALLQQRDWPEVSLVKIDVQGAEERVLGGATEILRRFRPALYLEVDDVALRQMGSCAERVLTSLCGAGYAICRLEAGKAWAPLSLEDAIRHSRSATYSDFLLVQKR